MAIANFELWSGITGDQDRRFVRYLVTGADNDREVLDHMEQLGAAPTGTPFFYDGMPRENITVTEISAKDQLWYSDAHYTRRPGNRPAALTNTEVDPDTTDPGDPVESDKDSFSFEISVQNQNERFLDTSKRVAFDTGVGPGGGNWTFVPFDGLNYDPRYGFRGRQLLRPRGSFSLTIFPEDSKVTRSYQKLVEDSVGSVNSTVFRTHAIGEVMLVGARGSARNRADWELTFTFEHRKNPGTVNLGNGVTLQNVQGWDIVDPYYEIDVTDLGGGKKAALYNCRQAILWREYAQIDFGPILQPT